MEIVENIREIDRRVKIIFICKRSDLAYKGYLYNVFRFLRKEESVTWYVHDEAVGNHGIDVKLTGTLTPFGVIVSVINKRLLTF